MFRLDFWFVLGSIWGRFGIHLGSQNRPKTLTTIDLERSGFRSCDRMVPRWLQDRPKRAPGEVLGPSWGGVLGRSWGLLGPLWTVLGGRFGFWGVVLDPFRVRFVDSIHRFDSMIRFADSIR